MARRFIFNTDEGQDRLPQAMPVSGFSLHFQIENHRFFLSEIHYGNGNQKQLSF
jgi:hypothetical protein